MHSYSEAHKVLYGTLGSGRRGVGGSAGADGLGDRGQRSQCHGLYLSGRLGTALRTYTHTHTYIQIYYINIEQLFRCGPFIMRINYAHVLFVVSKRFAENAENALHIRIQRGRQRQRQRERRHAVTA